MGMEPGTEMGTDKDGDGNGRETENWSGMETRMRMRLGMGAGMETETRTGTGTEPELHSGVKPGRFVPQCPGHRPCPPAQRPGPPPHPQQPPARARTPPCHPRPSFGVPKRGWGPTGTPEGPSTLGSTGGAGGAHPEGWGARAAPQSIPPALRGPPQPSFRYRPHSVTAEPPSGLRGGSESQPGGGGGTPGPPESPPRPGGRLWLGAMGLHPDFVVTRIAPRMRPLRPRPDGGALGGTGLGGPRAGWGAWGGGRGTGGAQPEGVWGILTSRDSGDRGDGGVGWCRERARGEGSGARGVPESWGGPSRTRPLPFNPPHPALTSAPGAARLRAATPGPTGVSRWGWGWTEGHGTPTPKPRIPRGGPRRRPGARPSGGERQRRRP